MHKSISTTCTLALVVVLCAFFAARANAASMLYVSTSGNDAADCRTPDRACRTVSQTLRKATYGDTISIASGTYNEAYSDHTTCKSLTLSGAGSDTTFLKFSIFTCGDVMKETVHISGVTIQAKILNQGNLAIANSTIADNGDVGPDVGHGGGIANAEHAKLTITHTIIKNNYVGGLATASGGGIANDGEATIIDSIIDGNSANIGGGIFNSGILTVANTTISNNVAAASEYFTDSGFGGGIYNSGILNITGNSLIQNNKAIRFGDGLTSIGGGGGGIYNQKTMAIKESTVDGNNSDGIFQGGGGILNVSGATISMEHSLISNNSVRAYGGGVYNLNGDVIITGSIISSNVSNSSGGGLANTGHMSLNTSTVRNNVSKGGGGIVNLGRATYTEQDAALLVMNSTINGNVTTTDAGPNTTSSGGGIVNIFGKLTLVNATISGNHAISAGGGIYNVGPLIIRSSTLFGNSADGQGGGIATNGVAEISNSILAANQSPTAYSDCYGSLTSQGYNIIGNSTNCNFSKVTGDQVGTHGNLIDPKLAPLQDNGGDTITHLPYIDSPAINAGNPATPGSGNAACPSADQRGEPRPFQIACDIGAVERVFRQFAGVIIK